ncbi:TPM domain-containing protein [Eupransor demetentiae]|uniref:Contains a TPM-fold domain (YgcG) n=1 Tax=Eupransor demetentiae TaxID=3109584 RepID=A0ABM9N5Q6_9LACO|nr:Uncharacterized membrane protein YgcG [Lactobacillaceae bacterium LMG 33000]
MFSAKKNAGWGWSIILAALAFLLSINFQQAYAENPDTIKPTKYYVLNDYANILTPASQQHIIDQEKKFKQTKQRPQIIVLTVNNSDGMDLQDFTNQLTLRKTWHPGRSGEDNGVIIVFAKNNGTNNVFISTGTGVESVLPDAKTNQILQSQKSKLKSSNDDEVNQGLMNVFDQVAKALPTDKAAPKKDNDSGMIFALIAAAILFVIVILVWNRMPKNHDDHDDDDHHHGGGSWIDWWLLSGLLSSGSNNSYGSGSDWGSSGGDFGGFTDSGGGGDFGGGGSGI